MNIAPVENTNLQFGSKAKFGLKFARDLNNVEYQMAEKLKDNLEVLQDAVAKLPLKSDVLVAQRGKDLLINSGEVTSYVKGANDMSAKKLYEAIEANVNVNNKTNNALQSKLDMLK